MSEGTPPLNYNPEHYPAFSVYDTTRRIGFDPIYRQAELLHLERGDGHYRARTLEYPPEGVSSVPLGDPAHGAHVSVFPASPLAPLQPLSHPSPQPAAARDDAQMLEARTSRSSPSLPTGSQSDNSASPATESGPIVVDLPESATDIRRRLGLDPDEEISLYALGDPPPGEKPNYQYTLLIQLAILGSPSKRTARGCVEALYPAPALTQQMLPQGSQAHHRAGQGTLLGRRLLAGRGQQAPPQAQQAADQGGAGALAREQSIVQRREEEEESGSSDEDDARGASVVDDANIDPQLRNQGHVVGEGRLRAGPATRSSIRRGHSPYTTGSSQGSPARAPLRMTPTPTPVPVSVSAPAAPRAPAFGQTTFGQPTFGQPTFGQSTFGQPTFGQPTFGQPTFGQPTFGQPTPLGQSTATSTRTPSAQNAHYMAAAGLMAMNTPPPPPLDASAFNAWRSAPGLTRPV
ncbi:hypothetical protein A0H81_07987 [Grifola frondosa]|uniref:Uncharacterized protein n=1 Tax=Grifola frondosa TaxID=5627 RepID=A0A1C7M6H3_GRIFR|nr:hypothetical protein A0H81_07987 [Grifola frondosa]